MPKLDRAVPVGLALLIPVTAALAHPDDPKQFDIDPPYVGPGYRAGQQIAAGEVFDAVGIELLSWLPVGDFGPGQSFANDCWGYTSPSGREYAIIGLSHATGFVEITDPGNPTVVGVVPGPSGNTWRDIKVYQHHAYAVSEDGGGVQVIPMTDIDNGNLGAATFITTGGNESTHNVALNEDSGYLYRCGGSGNGLRIYDLSDPTTPEWVASWSDKYVHDAQIVSYTSGPWANREIAFCCAGFNGGGVNTGLTILDVTDKENIFEMAPHLEYPDAGYSHQGWLSPDRSYFYLGDEADESGGGLNSTIHVINVVDLTAPFHAAAAANGMPSITHNLYTLDNLIFAANYSSGIRVFDATDPLNHVEIAYFDTHPDDDAVDFGGLWSNYPYFPSGTVIGSDRSRGLFVWSLESQPLAFSYPNGLPSELPTSGGTIEVEIVATEQDALDPSSVTLHYDDGEGFTPVSMAALGGSLFEAEFPTLNCFGAVHYYFSAQTLGGVTVNDPPTAPTSSYSATVASQLVVVLDDDFESDLGWTPTLGNATDGEWERGVPIDDPGWAYDPATDGDGSGQCWLTANQPGESDVDGGIHFLISPEFDLSAGDTGISYEYFVRLDDPNGFDGLRVEANSDGAAAGGWTLIAWHADDGGLDWHHAELMPDDLEAAGLNLTSTVSFRFTAGDAPPESIVELGLDGFRLLQIQCSVFADLDGDGVVGTTDFLQLLAEWGPCDAPCPPSCAADLDEDCNVGTTDFLLLLANWSF